MTWVWLALISVGVGLEAYALRSRAKGDTLSEQVWSLRDLAKRYRVDAVANAVIIGTLGWMALHFIEVV